MKETKNVSLIWSKADTAKIEAAEMWLLRKMERISRAIKTTNMEVFNKTIWSTLLQRWLANGQVLRRKEEPEKSLGKELRGKYWWIKSRDWRAQSGRTCAWRVHRRNLMIADVYWYGAKTEMHQASAFKTYNCNRFIIKFPKWKRAKPIKVMLEKSKRSMLKISKKKLTKTNFSIFYK